MRFVRTFLRAYAAISVRAALAALTLVGVSLTAATARAQVISEFMASNGAGVVDEDGDNSDWIEVHNDTPTALELTGWALTDDASKPSKWTFGETHLGPDEYLVVFASGKDRHPGSGSWTSVVQNGDVFRYFEGTESAPNGWHLPQFDDGTWAEGASPLGYERSDGGADIETEVQEGLLTLYTRISFQVNDPSSVKTALLHVDYDDGFVAYLNGTEIARRNVVPAEPAHDTPASDLREAEIYQGGVPEKFDIHNPADQLVQGENVLAIEVHNANETSSDLTLIPFLTLEIGELPEGSRGVAQEVGPLGGTEHHTNFSLSRDGEYLALVDPNGSAASEYDPYPPQRGDVSYGLLDDGVTYFDTPTPGSANAAGTGGFVDEPTLSAEHGIYDAPFSLFVFPETPGSIVRYTLDGSQPTEDNGKSYIGPLRIEKTTVVRAAAFKEGALPSKVVTRTYLFLDDVLRQSADGLPPPGWPVFWGGNLVDYGMDPSVVDGNEADLLAALAEIPSFSITMEIDSLFDPLRGIYSNAMSYGRSWERPASIELIYPPDFSRLKDGVEYHGPLSGFQVDAGVRIRGGWSRNDQNPKHAFRIFFRSEYGPSLLEYPLFGAEGVDTFDKFDLRTSQNYSWAMYGDTRNTLVRDVFARDVQRDMGVPYTRSRYYHLYLNGQYWGVFQTQERADHWHGAEYLGGEADDFDVVKSAGLDGGYEMEITEGTVDAWRALYDGANRVAAAASEEADSLYMVLQGLDPDGSRNPDYPVLLDADNLIQYMLVVFFTGNPDSPITPFMATNNFFGYRDRSGDRGFVWFAHDFEHTLLPELGNYFDRTGPFPAGSEFRFSNPQWIHQQLMGSPEYRLRFADLARRHLFEGGTLTTDAAVARWDARAQEVRPVMPAESARWGDAKREPPLTVADWENEIDRVREDVLPPRRDAILQQLRTTRRYRSGDPRLETIDAPLYPSVEAPEFSSSGGAVNAGYELSMTAGDSADIFFTLDGSDPRAIRGAPAAAAQRYDGPVPLSGRVEVTARARGEEGAWSALTRDEFYAGTSRPSSSSVVISEVNYHPTEPSEAERALGFDDQNDFEFVEVYNPSGASVSLEGLSFTDGISFTFGAEALGPGERTVVASSEAAFRARYGDAVRSSGSFASGRLSNGGERVALADADGRLLFEIEYSDGDGWPARADGAGSSLELIDAGSPDRAESWKASTAYHGTPGAAPAAAPGVVINEILSHTDPPELDAVELHNVTDAAVDLSGWLLSDESDVRKFVVPAGTSIDAGAYVVFDEADFNASGTDRDFAFDGARGDEAWLVETDDSGKPIRFADVVSFPAARNGESFGRDSDGSMVPVQAPTLGSANRAPRAGRVVFREIMYHPPGNNENLEYVTILNTADAAEDLTSWTLRGGVDFVFPEGRVLAPGDSLVVVAFDPESRSDKAATFRKAYGWPDSVPFVGGWDGRLANEGERLVLHRPDEPPADEPDFVPETIEEVVTYRDAGDWPSAADGEGSSLFRVDVGAFSADPRAWTAAGRPFQLYEDHQEPDAPPVSPSHYVLSEIYPNPVRERAQTVLTVGETQRVRATLYDMLGRRVRQVFDTTAAAGELHTIGVDAAGLASGVYLLRIDGESFTSTRSITVVK